MLACPWATILMETKPGGQRRLWNWGSDIVAVSFAGSQPIIAANAIYQRPDVGDLWTANEGAGLDGWIRVENMGDHGTIAINGTSAVIDSDQVFQNSFKIIRNGEIISLSVPRRWPQLVASSNLDGTQLLVRVDARSWILNLNESGGEPVVDATRAAEPEQTPWTATVLGRGAQVLTIGQRHRCLGQRDRREKCQARGL